jgi:hypothetical protein
MKLDKIHKNSLTPDRVVLEQYTERLKKLMRGPGVLTEGKVIVVVDDDGPKEKVIERYYGDSNGPKNEVAREEFIEKAKQLGSFGDSNWVEQIINGLKQAGVQGCNPIQEEDKPVTTKDLKQLIGMLVEYIKSTK